MKTHLRPCLFLLGLSLVICCVLYPLALWAFGRVFFPSAAAGSLIAKADGKEIVGSQLIAQSFTGNEYFWPRPSAVSYNATASGASNYGASNPKLRDRVAQQLGPLVVYKKGSPSAGPDQNQPRKPQQDIEQWFAARPDRVAVWAAEFDTAAAGWAKTDLKGEEYGVPGKFIQAWKAEHKEIVEKWKAANNAKTEEPKPEDLVAFFFASYAEVNPGRWPGIKLNKQTGEKKIEPVTSDDDLASGSPSICSNFFEMWLRDPANKDKVTDLEPVVADMVMASGSGLDPHITLRNALSVYQLDRIAAKRTKPGADGKKVRDAIASLARERSFTPLGGLIGEPLVNVLELNRELDEKFPVPPSGI